MNVFLKSFFGIFLFLFCLSFFIDTPVLATGNYQLDVFAGKAGYSTTGTKASLEATVQLVINTVLSLTGIIFLVLAVYAGVRWMTAQGNTDMVTKAQETLQAAIIGMVVVSISYAVTTVIFKTIQNKIPADNSVPTVVQDCKKDSDCNVGEKCDGFGKCYASNCSDSVNMCGGSCVTKCAIGQKCLVMSDCSSGNCSGGVCANTVNCSAIKIENTCIINSSCNWDFIVVNGVPTEACVDYQIN